jgi:hypothetical protein
VDRYHRLKFAFLIITLFANLTESHFARPSLTWFTLLLLALNFPHRRAEETASDEPQDEMHWSMGVEGGAALAVPVHRADQLAV